MSTNKKSFFSPKLMFEGFRQCKMIGIFALIIMVLGAILLPAGTAISYSDSSGYSGTFTETVEAFNINTFLLLLIPVSALMTLVLFHFLDNRSASDLYHALPHKRITLFLSYSASIILWMLILLFASTLCSVLTCLIVQKHIILIMSTILPYMFSVLLMSLLTVTGIMVAINLTGTVFTNIVISGVILLLPRICFTLIHSTVFDSVPFLVSSSSDSIIFSDTSNLLFGLISLIGSL